MNRAGTAGTLERSHHELCRGMPTTAAHQPAAKPTAWLYGDRLRMGGVKLYADGALGSRGAWLKAPYRDKPDTRGLQFLTR